MKKIISILARINVSIKEFEFRVLTKKMPQISFYTGSHSNDL